MHIVYLNPNGIMGGAEVALLDMLAGIRSDAPEWTLDLIVAGNGPLAARASALGVNPIVLPFPRSLARIGDASAGGPAGRQTGRWRLLGRLLFAGPGIAGYIIRLRQIIRRLNQGRGPDVIHSNGFKMHILGALAKPAGVPLIWHIHDYLSCRPFMARFIRAFQKRSSLVLANSNSVKADIESVLDNPVAHAVSLRSEPVKQTVSLRRSDPTLLTPSRSRRNPEVQTLYNAVDTSVFSPDGPRLDLDQLSGLPAPDDSLGPIVRVGLLATFARWKGHEVFLRALSLIPHDIPLRGYIIGDALYQTDGSQYSIAELKSLAQQLGLSDRVGFTGFVDQPAAAMRALDIVVHASTEPEPFGLVIVEAMASGRAVIISDAGGATELISSSNGRFDSSNGRFESDQNALVHTPGDAVQLAERIQQLAIDLDLRKRLSTAGRVTAETRFDRSRLASELVPIYQGLAAHRPLPTAH